MKRVTVKRILALILALVGAICLIPLNSVFAEDGETVRKSQDVREIIDATMTELADTVTAPAFGTNAGEWTVLCLARGGYYAKCNKYFTDYYGRIVEYVNTQAAKIGKDGALHKSKSTDNSRLILALSAIGRVATAVGDWNLITPYSDFDWVKKQGINGVIFTLIAIDSNGYETTDATIRRQCIDYLLDKQLEDGGWALSGKTFNSDITGMTLQALAPYRGDKKIADAAGRAFECLSLNQCESGGYKYGTGESSESIAQVIVACAYWGIDPDTDPRFIKNGNSAVDALLEYYDPEKAMFKHFLQADVNNMATDQSCYALIAYDRLINGGTALYDYSDVVFAYDEESLHDREAVVSPPTCTEGGYTLYTCLGCGNSYSGDETEALGHTAGEWIVETEAAVGVAGSKYKLCTVCSVKLETSTVDALPDNSEEPADGNGNGGNGDITVICTVAAAVLCTVGVVFLYKKKKR